MLAISAALAAFAISPIDISGFYQMLDAARKADDLKAVVGTFGKESDSRYLRDFARANKGIANTGLKLIPAPPGWESTGKYWAIFHAPNDLQSDHDVVIGVRPAGNAWQLGPEVRESTNQGVRISHIDATVTLLPTEGRANIVAGVRLRDNSGAKRAPIFRLNDFYQISAASARSQPLSVQAVKDFMPTAPAEGTVVRAGGLVVLWRAKAPQELSFTITGQPAELTSDRVDASRVYLTGYWLPSLARLPHTTAVTMVGPKEWVMESEGNLVDRKIQGNWQTVHYQCDLPISYPKVIGGAYREMASAEVGGVSMSVFHQGEGDAERAKKELALLADGMKFYLDTFEIFPFDHYNLYDSDSYYGIESYSYTILHKRITSWAISHEMGHTYFGGVVPNSHTFDSWNEGMTQYVDSVWYKKNSDRTLNSGFNSTRYAVPLTQIESPWADGSISYMRGAYLLNMLEQEIGHPAMVKALKAMIKDRPGKDTTWESIRPYFEAASGQKLDWFWKQWFRASTFPKFELDGGMASPSPEGFVAKANVRIQAPVANSRLRYAVKWTAPGHELITPYKTTVQGSSFAATVEQKLAFRPERVEVVLFPYTLATGGGSVEVGFTLSMPNPLITAAASPIMISH